MRNFMGFVSLSAAGAMFGPASMERQPRAAQIDEEKKKDRRVDLGAGRLT
jgi:hypothetical protein